jgi:uncharacterized membrane protein
MQLPIILTGLALGPCSGGLVGFIGAAVMAFRLRPPNPCILRGNAILGFMAGMFYSRLKKMRVRQIILQVISVLGAYIVQFPYCLRNRHLSHVYTLVCGSNAYTSKTSYRRRL